MTGIAIGDVDGDLVFATAGSRERLYINDGKGDSAMPACGFLRARRRWRSVTGSILFGNLFVEGTNVSTFRRDLRPSIPQPMVITGTGLGETFEVKMRLTEDQDRAFAYDVWAGGSLDTP